LIDKVRALEERLNERERKEQEMATLWRELRGTYEPMAVWLDYMLLGELNERYKKILDESKNKNKKEKDSF